MRNFEGFFKTSTLDAPNFEIPVHPCKLLFVETLDFADPTGYNTYMRLKRKIQGKGSPLQERRNITLLIFAGSVLFMDIVLI